MNCKSLPLKLEAVLELSCKIDNALRAGDVWRAQHHNFKLYDKISQQIRELENIEAWCCFHAKATPNTPSDNHA